MKISFSIIVFCFVIILLDSGCSKDKLVENSPSIITADNLFVNKAGFENGLNGLYNETRRWYSSDEYGGTGNLMQEETMIGVDNAYGNWRSPREDIFNLWGPYNNSATTVYTSVWGWLYETVNIANTIIDRAQNPKIDWTETDKNEIIAEAKCIRAWCYRHLTYLWGAVPLVLNESKGSNIRTDWQRIPVSVIRDSMEADLQFAEKYLPEVSANDGKVIRGVAQTYLAELYLAEGKPQQAKETALLVTQNPNYALVSNRFGVNKNSPGTPFTDIFIQGNSNRSDGNTEALWVFQNEQNVIGGEGYNIMGRYWINRYYSLKVKGTDGKSKNPIAISNDNGGRGIGRLAPTRFALDLYDNTDDRGSEFAWRLYWIINNPGGIPKGYNIGDTVYINKNKNEKLSDPDWPSTRKWDHVNPIDVNASHQYNDAIYLRSANAWLLLAEACFYLNDNQGGADAINVLRVRAHAPLITQDQVTLDFILDERSRELFSEEERRYTLLRTHSWMRRTQLYNKIAGANIIPRDTIFPIPLSEINANISNQIQQNPGY